MGSQQMLLIVLGVIVVGTAVSISLLFFDTNAEQANKDALTQDCLKLAAAGQAYYRLPRVLGGGEHSFEGITIRHCGMETDDKGVGVNLTGSFSIAGASGSTMRILAASAGNPERTVTVMIDMGTTDPARQLAVSYAGW